MAIDPRAGKPAGPQDLVNLPRLVTSYYALKPDPAEKTQRVAFGTSGHRGSAFHAAFNENHILTITQAICRYRKEQNTTGPLFLGMDTHGLSEPALVSALEVLAANEVEVMVDQDNGLSDGIVITPSHNPPEDGGFKYNPPSGGPADTGATKWIENEANSYLANGLKDVRRVPYAPAIKAGTTHKHDYVSNYVNQ